MSHFHMTMSVLMTVPQHHNLVLLFFITQHNIRLGVQIAYYAIIFTQFSMMVLSVLLAIGTYTVSSNFFMDVHDRMEALH